MYIDTAKNCSLKIFIRQRFGIPKKTHINIKFSKGLKIIVVVDKWLYLLTDIFLKKKYTILILRKYGFHN